MPVSILCSHCAHTLLSLCSASQNLTHMGHNQPLWEFGPHLPKSFYSQWDLCQPQFCFLCGSVLLSCLLRLGLLFGQLGGVSQTHQVGPVGRSGIQKHGQGQLTACGCHMHIAEEMQSPRPPKDNERVSPISRGLFTTLIHTPRGTADLTS